MLDFGRAGHPLPCVLRLWSVLPGPVAAALRTLPDAPLVSAVTAAEPRGPRKGRGERSSEEVVACVRSFRSRDEVRSIFADMQRLDGRAHISLAPVMAVLQQHHPHLYEMATHPEDFYCMLMEAWDALAAVRVHSGGSHA